MASIGEHILRILRGPHLLYVLRLIQFGFSITFLIVMIFIKAGPGDWRRNLLLRAATDLGIAVAAVTLSVGIHGIYYFRFNRGFFKGTEHAVCCLVTRVLVECSLITGWGLLTFGFMNKQIPGPTNAWDGVRDLSSEHQWSICYTMAIIEFAAFVASVGPLIMESIQNQKNQKFAVAMEMAMRNDPNYAKIIDSSDLESGS
ncbi:hypothetical protein MMC09_001096 [Bachmanniomyces sp. S44760]|nr:hypothetical protein [Bachmanniomyces sp. S44760]